MSVWTESGIARLRALWDRGDSTNMIAVALSVSKNAIVGKAHRLGLDQRPSPIIRDGERLPLKVRTAPVKTLPPLASELPRAGPIRPPETSAPAPLPIPPSAAARPVAGNRACCFPIGERPYRYCDKPTFGRLSYCEEHARRSYMSEGWRRRESAGELAYAGGDD